MFEFAGNPDSRILRTSAAAEAGIIHDRYARQGAILTEIPHGMPFKMVSGCSVELLERYSELHPSVTQIVKLTRIGISANVCQSTLTHQPLLTEGDGYHEICHLSA